jgi:hypothetical protein
VTAFFGAPIVIFMMMGEESAGPMMDDFFLLNTLTVTSITGSR